MSSSIRSAEGELTSSRAFDTGFEGENARLTFSVSEKDDTDTLLDITINLPLKNPQLLEIYGKKIEGRIVIFGPPAGCRTYLSRALTDGCNSTFYRFGVGAMIDKYREDSEKVLHNLFESARRKAPAIIILDDWTLFGSVHVYDDNSWGRALRNTKDILIREIDDLGKPDNPILLVGATPKAAPTWLDFALRLPSGDSIIGPPSRPVDHVWDIPEPRLERRLRLYAKDKPVQGRGDAFLVEFANALDTVRTLKGGLIQTLPYPIRWTVLIQFAMGRDSVHDEEVG